MVNAAKLFYKTGSNLVSNLAMVCGVTLKEDKFAMWIIQQRYVDTERQTLSTWANLPYIYDYKEDAQRGIETWKNNYVSEPKIFGLDYEYRIAKVEVLDD